MIAKTFNIFLSLFILNQRVHRMTRIKMITKLEHFE